MSILVSPYWTRIVAIRSANLSELYAKCLKIEPHCHVATFSCALKEIQAAQIEGETEVNEIIRGMLEFGRDPIRAQNGRGGRNVALVERQLTAQLLQFHRRARILKWIVQREAHVKHQ